MYELFDSADELLSEEADAIVEGLKETKVNYYNQYFAARVIKELGVSRGSGDNPEEPPAPQEQLK